MEDRLVTTCVLEARGEGKRHAHVWWGAPVFLKLKVEKKEEKNIKKVTEK